MRAGWVVLSFVLVTWAGAAQAADIGQIKTSKGAVSIERAGQSLRGDAGARLQGSDVVRTGNDGSVGITMTDNSLLSAGPNSVLVARPLRVRLDDQCRTLRCIAAARHARRRVGPPREAVLRRDDGAHTVGDSRRARHRIRRHRSDDERCASRLSAVAIALAAALAGCASRTERIILLPEQDGRPTAIVVKQGGSRGALDQPYAAAELSYADPWAYRASDAEVQATFKDALARAAGPRRAFHAVLHRELARAHRANRKRTSKACSPT